MTNADLENKSLEETASYVCTKLQGNDIDVVLSGGSCMEIYTQSNFSSYDIDLIMTKQVAFNKIEKVMLSLGFEKENRYFKYKNNPNYIEFPTGPVTLGDEFPKKFVELKTHLGTLKLLSATDCIKDRLCAMVYHGGEECFNQAVAVAHLNKIDINNLKAWGSNEDNEIGKAIEKLTLVVDLLKKETNRVEDKKTYLEMRCKELYLDMYKKEDFEELKEELHDDYVAKELFLDNSYDNLFHVLDKFYDELIKK